MTTREAADALQVSVRQVLRLAEAGDLAIVRRVGTTALISAASVHRYAHSRAGRGRPFDEATAWAALALLSGHDVDWIAPSQLSRLRNRLVRAGVDQLAAATRRRAVVSRYRLSPGAENEVRRHLALTGASAVQGGVLEGRTNLGSGGRGLEGYVMADVLERLVDAFHMLQDPGGNVTLRILSEAAAFREGSPPVAAAAVDLMESLDARERRAGRELLNELQQA